MKAKKAIFEYRRLPGYYSGYYFDEVSDLWNGYYMPWFPLGISMVIMEDANKTPLLSVDITYEHELNAFAVEDLVYTYLLLEEEIQTVEGLKKLYPIGSSQWEWTIKEQ